MNRRPRLSTRLTLEERQATPDGAGGSVVTWVPLGDIWGEVTARTGRESAVGDTTQSLTSFRIVIRHVPEGAPSRPRPDQRLRTGARLFRIVAIGEQAGDPRYLTCFCLEEAPA